MLLLSLSLPFSYNFNIHVLIFFFENVYHIRTGINRIGNARRTKPNLMKNVFTKQSLSTIRIK